jgi:hypothetical protein
LRHVSPSAINIISTIHGNILSQTIIHVVEVNGKSTKAILLYNAQHLIDYFLKVMDFGDGT